MSHHYRGHTIIELEPGYWIYKDIGIPVSWDKDRPCGHCGLANTSEGHDGCLGTLPGVMNACCGHGEEGSAYIMYESGNIIRGKHSLVEMMKMKGCK